MNTRRDLFLLTALCAVMYGTGLTTQGLSNWQEAQRAIVAREMQRTGSWLVPTINGHPYLAKPPLVYWAQIGIARALGKHRQTGEFELRLTVALAGLAGVLGTYFAARALFPPESRAPITSASYLPLPASPAPPRAEPETPCLPISSPLLAALFTATGILYVRSSRIGELDILLVPFVTLAVGGVALSWRSHREHRRAHWGGVVLAAVAATGAIMTKGPPALAVIALATYGGIALYAAFTGNPLDTALLRRSRSPFAPAPRFPRGVLAGAGALAGGAGAVLSARQAHSVGDWCGVAILGAVCAVLGIALVSLAQPRRARACLAALAHTHPLIVLGVPAMVFWLWTRAVQHEIGHEAVLALAAEEAEDNLRLLIPISPIKNLEALSYGAGLGSITALAAIIWLLCRRARPRPEWYVLFAWLGLGFALFSLATKGVPRYLTPLWPAASMLGALFLTRPAPGAGRAPGASAASAPGQGRRVAILMGTVALLGLGQAFWYAYGRQRWYADRSPRDFVGDLLRPERAVNPARLGTLDFRTPAVDFYVGRAVRPVGETGMRASMAGIEAWSLEDLRREVRGSGKPFTLLVRGGAVERLELELFVVETIPVEARFTIDNGKAEVRAVRVTVR